MYLSICAFVHFWPSTLKIVLTQFNIHNFNDELSGLSFNLQKKHLREHFFGLFNKILMPIDKIKKSKQKIVRQVIF